MHDSSLTINKGFEVEKYLGQLQTIGFKVLPAQQPKAGAQASQSTPSSPPSYVLVENISFTGRWLLLASKKLANYSIPIKSNQ
jgi:hypothetical protein